MEKRRREKQRAGIVKGPALLTFFFSIILDEWDNVNYNKSADGALAKRRGYHEQLMNLDLKNAYEEAFAIADRQEEITIELLCSLSGIVMKNTGSLYNTIAGTFNSADGELRLLNVSAGSGG